MTLTARRFRRNSLRWLGADQLAGILRLRMRIHKANSFRLRMTELVMVPRRLKPRCIR
jgi:hypothetical protein